jgi:preprotein translocase SecE subunit
MAVAVKTEPTAGAGIASFGLAGASLAGALYIAAGVIVLYHLLPWLWMEQFATEAQAGNTITRELGFYLRASLVGLMVAGAAALIYLWPRIFKPQPGFRMGAAMGVVLLLAGAVVVELVGLFVQWLGIIPKFAPSPDGQVLIGGILAAAIAALWLWGMVRLFRKERFQERLVSWEEQGWFSAKSYKKGQGLRARRATMLAIMGVVGCGLWVHLQSSAMFSAAPWEVTLPYHIGQSVVVMWLPAFTSILVVGAATIWFSYRLVNFPKFADFLIATEAEMSKVTWSGRRRLIQDTIVVLVTVVLMTVFLYAMDITWSALLTWLGVLHTQQ